MAVARPGAPARRRPDDIRAALIEALAQRYSPDLKPTGQALDRAYADAMEAVQARFPADADVALLTADALMNLTPGITGSDGGRKPKGATERMVALIEGVLGTGRSVRSPPIPLTPARSISTSTPSRRRTTERAAPHAARLEAPDAGRRPPRAHAEPHLVPLGRWRESLDANLRAAAADEAQLGKGGASLLYSQGYFAHNVHFVLASALMGGDGTRRWRRPRNSPRS